MASTNRIIKRITVPPFMENIYIVGDLQSSTAILVDPGAQANQVLFEINRLGFSVPIIANTHGHLDHVGAVNQIMETMASSFCMSHFDIPVMEAGFLQGLEMIPDWQNPPLPDRDLHDGELISTGDINLEVIATPGHTPGGVSFLGDGVLFSGDTLFRRSVGRTDLFGGNEKTLFQSITDRLLSLPDETIVYPGHGAETTIGEEKANNPFLI